MSCSRSDKDSIRQIPTEPFMLVLGNVQDAGSPHISCKKSCCVDLRENPDPSRKVVSLGLVDPDDGKTFIIEATPDLPDQMELLHRYATFKPNDEPDGIFITHAHMGHYTGLMYLGREAKGAKNISVHVMPKMKNFLETNGPWSQLVQLNNIDLQSLEEDSVFQISKNISIKPFIVPHRDEYSETVGYEIHGPTKRIIFIPDIDKWEKWNKDIKLLVEEFDLLFLDATFFDNYEISFRPIAEIPHPFVIESMELFQDLSEEEKNKVYFTHLNHTNPLLNQQSEQTTRVLNSGYNISRYKDIFQL